MYGLKKYGKPIRSLKEILYINVVLFYSYSNHLWCPLVCNLYLCVSVFLSDKDWGVLVVW